jgi:ELWxxDGT repeat protein
MRDPGNRFDNAKRFNFLNRLRVFEDTVSRDGDRSDTYRFRTFRQRSFFYADLYDLRGDANLILYNSRRKIVARSIRIGRNPEVIRLGANDDQTPRRPALGPGVYYLRVFFRGQLRQTPYTLRASASRAPNPTIDPVRPPRPGDPVGRLRPELVADINRGDESGVFGGSDFAVLDNTLYFSANDGNDGFELWKSQGTRASTEQVEDIFSGDEGSFPSGFTVFNDAVYFSANDGRDGFELWKTDGTSRGTTQVADINRGDESSFPSSLTVVDDFLYFAADDGRTGRELWRVSIDDNVSQVANINPRGGSNPSSLVAFDGMLYFAADDGREGRELWRSDGTSFGTEQVEDINRGDEGSFPSELTVVGSSIFFAADDGRDGRELWEFRGGFVNQVSDINRGDAGSSPSWLVSFDGKLYFSADGGDNDGRELWVSEGTRLTTEQVDDINRGDGSSSPSFLTVVNDRLYFAADGGRGDGRELWATDGTARGTEQVADINRSSGLGSNPSNLTAARNRLYFVANDGNDGSELWRLDV